MCILKCKPFALAVLLALGTVAVSPVAAQISAVPQVMNFQGRLATPAGNPVPDGTYSVRFSLWNVASGGTVAANEKWNQTVSTVQVKNGTFAVALDVSGGAADKFNGNLWLEVKIGTAAALTPRTPLVSVPYAIKSDLALTVPDGSITGAKIAAGTLTADKFASGVLNGTGWLLGGNSGVTSSQFLGTLGKQPLELRVNNRRVMRYAYAEDTTNANANYHYRSMNVIGGSEINGIAANVVGATIAGGGVDWFNITDAPNTVTGNFGTVGGGGNNTVGAYAVASGGADNSATGLFSTLAGGWTNVAYGDYATVSGGYAHAAFGNYSTVSGGYNNQAHGNYATVAGGQHNYAYGVNSFAAGSGAYAAHDGAWVWADNSPLGFVSTGDNQFLIRASGGVGINTDDPAGDALNVNGTAKAKGLTLSGSGLGGAGNAVLKVGNGRNNVGVFVGDLTPIGRAAFESRFSSADDTSHIYCATNDTPIFTIYGNGSGFLSGTLAQSSDARYKKNVADLGSPLDSLLGLRGVTFEWNDKNKEQGKQIGFIAQEVEKIFLELVKTDAMGYKSVNYIGVVPVLVEAVKAQNKKVEILGKENAELKAKNNTLEARLDAIERAFAELKANR